MNKIKQNAKGNNNLQIITNNGKIIQTKQIKQVTEVLYDPNQYITDAQALEIRNKITEFVDMLAATGKNKGLLFSKNTIFFIKNLK